MKRLCIICSVLLWQYGNGTQNNVKYPTRAIAVVPLEHGKTGLKITWEPVESWDKQDPIIGYKVVFWEVKMGKTVVHKFVNGELYDEEIENPNLPEKIEEPKVYTVPFDKPEVVHEVKPEVWYDSVALAFTKKGEGPLSPISRVKAYALTNVTDAMKIYRVSNTTDVHIKP